MKTFLWLSTIAGLLPLVSLVVLHLLLMAHVHWTNRDPDAIVFVGDTQVSIGSLRPVHLSSKPWPSLLILAGAASVACGLWFLTQTPRVVNEDESASIATEDTLGNVESPPGNAES